MAAEISIEVRQFVTERAAFRCEYCLMPEQFALHKHEPDHIIPHQHGGLTNRENLALACFRCNRYKGPNVGSFDPESGILTAFFNPRTQIWTEHFALDGGVIRPQTAIGRVTEKILRFNSQERILEREGLIHLGLYAV